jgi:hypothetical protein
MQKIFTIMFGFILNCYDAKLAINTFIPLINPLPVQFKSLLHGQEGCVFFSGHLNLRTCQCVLVHLGWQPAFKFSTL